LTPGLFVVSLDFELMWGVRDGRTKEAYGHRVLGERQAVPAILAAFERWGIRATWATVGFAMCDGRDELMARAPNDRPTFADARRSNYSYLDEAGGSERDDPYYFAPSLVREIASCPGQEIATHTFSHYCTLEPGQTEDQFSADLDVAMRQMDDWKLDCRSIVFPRNQYSAGYLRSCAARGLKTFRGTERRCNGRGRATRALRLFDTFVPLTGANTAKPSNENGLVNLPSNRFLRPFENRFASLECLRLRRITSAMTAAAKRGEVFHLWWHPHNFGADLGENMLMLRRVLSHFRRLEGDYGMRSATMAEAA